jgi:hypothetical protein
MTEPEDDTPHCPVCKDVSGPDIVASAGLVITGLKALADRDLITIQNVYDAGTAYDFHLCITILFNLLVNVAEATGSDINEYLSEARADINAVTLHGI